MYGSGSNGSVRCGVRRDVHHVVLRGGRAVTAERAWGSCARPGPITERRSVDTQQQPKGGVSV